MIKACFFDIDGTLVDHGAGGVVPVSTLSSLRALHRKGIKLFVATGRIPAMLDIVSEVFPFDGFVALNGQMVLKRDGTVIHRMAHEPETVRQFLRVAHRERIPGLVIEEKTSFATENSPEVEAHFRYAGLPVPPAYDAARLAEHPVLQLLAYIPMERSAPLKAVPGLEVTSAGGSILDVIPAGGGKEAGIAAAAAYYGFSRENTMAFGDGDNDACMLRWAGTGVAMGNGSPAAQEAADYITAPVGEDGIQKALLHFGVLTPEELSEQR